MENTYVTLLKLSWSNGFVYRTSLVMWRLRQFLGSIMALTVWTVIYSQQTSSFGYERAEMITYVFLVSILQSVILATSLHGLSDQINSGQLSTQLVKPLNIFGYLFTQEVADKLKNLLFIAVESVLLFVIFRPQISLPQLEVFPVFLLFVIGAVLLHFFIQLIFGSFGFWSPESWGPRFLFFMFVDFTAGKLFPLDILPVFFQQLIYLTPFPYLSFVQIQLFLGKLSPADMLQQGVVLLLWLTVLGAGATWLWKKGLRNYTAAGQ